MLIKVGNFEFTEVWDGVLYKTLSQYPNITAWEIRNLIEFTEYEKMYGRECAIECEESRVKEKILAAFSDKAQFTHVPPPQLITECTACPARKGCATKFVCHTTAAENAVSIFQSGKLLSAVRARKISAEELTKEKRNAANDPADYFEYIMFSWGNCQAGDRLVMERKLGRFPDEKDLSVNFTPGVRFYFRYEELLKHPSVVFDGVLPMKVKDELILADWVYAIVIPPNLRKQLEKWIPDSLKDRVLYVEKDCKDIWEWSEKIYSVIEKL